MAFKGSTIACCEAVTDAAEESPRSSEALNDHDLVWLLHFVHACVIGAAHDFAGTCHVLRMFFWFAIASCDAWFDRMPKRWKPWNACRRSTVLIGRKVQSSDMREEWKSAFALWNCVFDGVCCIRICLWIHACQMYIKSIIYIYIYISWACWFGIIFRLFNQLPKFIYN